MSKSNPDNPKAKAEVKSKSKAEAKQRTKTEVKSKAEVKSKSKAEVKAKPRKKAESKPKSEQKSKKGGKPKTTPKRKSKKMKKFTVSGSFMMGDKLQKFQKEVEALGESRARERILQDLGSRHRVKRSRVVITAVEVTK